MFSRILLRQCSRAALAARNVRPMIQVRTLARSPFNTPKTDKNAVSTKDTYLIFPELLADGPIENEFTVLPSNGHIPFDALNVEKIVKATGRFSIEFEHFIDEVSTTLRREFADQDVSNAKLNEFIAEMEKHLVPLNYNLNLLNSFRTIRRNEFNFVTFNDFFTARYVKSRQRFLDRQIYCFMCEMKARREFFDDGNASDPNDKKAFEQKQKNQIVDRYIRESKLLGQSLKHQDQMSVFKLIQEKLNEAQLSFVNTTAQATANFQKTIISPQFLDCLPDHVITNINHRDASSVFQSFMRYCPDQNLRKDFWYSYHGRSANVMGSKLSNSRVIQSIRDFRNRKAKLLGYESFAQMAVDLRAAGGQTMAGSVENVSAFVDTLNARIDKRFTENIKELGEFATTKPKQPGSKTSPKNTVEEMNLWDLKYFERLFLRKHYQIDSREVRAYFPMNRVVSGMLNFAENLFGLKIVEQKPGDGNAEVWGPNCRLFKVFSNNSKSMAELGSFYFDPFQRESRIIMAVPRCDSLGIKPLSFLLMNFDIGGSIFDKFDKSEVPSPKEEVLFGFDQVVEMFGKFGFVLQHILTEVQYSEINSLNNVEADAFYLVNHFMRYWPLNSYEVIKNCSAHTETGEPISEEFYQRLNKAYYHFMSLSLKNDLYTMAMDLNLHASDEPTHTVRTNTWNQYMSPFENHEDDGHLCAAVDIFSGTGQESVLYANKWSEVIAADVFEAFRADSSSGMKTDDQIKQLGERFRETFLAQTGAVSTNELFRRFRGRDPVLDGFLSLNQLE